MCAIQIGKVGKHLTHHQLAVATFKWLKVELFTPLEQLPYFSQVH